MNIYLGLFYWRLTFAQFSKNIVRFFLKGAAQSVRSPSRTRRFYRTHIDGQQVL